MTLDEGGWRRSTVRIIAPSEALRADGSRRGQRLMLVGARAGHHDVDLSGRHLLIGAHLRPGTLPLITHRPAVRFTNRSVPLAAWSAATGYADQPHLIRDCRALLGESPAAFVQRAG